VLRLFKTTIFGILIAAQSQQVFVKNLLQKLLQQQALPQFSSVLLGELTTEKLILAIWGQRKI
jgi:hypothetical protein